MIKVITYGTYDLLHRGHIRLLERAKALGDYLIVGVTSDDYDKSRGKINVKQSLMERIEAIRATGIADEIIVEEYEGQKIDDIKRYGVDIFTVGSDWVGYFDYLKDFCKVVYLERTEGVSSSDIRTQERKIKFGLVGESPITSKFAKEAKAVNGIEVVAITTCSEEIAKSLGYESLTYSDLLNVVDAVYIVSEPSLHYEQIKMALTKGKHVLCETPIALSAKQNQELFEMAKSNSCVLMDSIKTAYSTAYSRLLLLAKTDKIGKIISVDATATSLRDISDIRENAIDHKWNSITAWGPTAMLPVFQLLGTKYKQLHIFSKFSNRRKMFDSFTKVHFVYDDAVGTITVGKGVKSEGSLIISGTEGYIYVPAPWWKTDYFEIRYENTSDNKRYFYQLDGEGIRYELVAFVKAIESGKMNAYIDQKVSLQISAVMEEFYANHLTELN